MLGPMTPYLLIGAIVATLASFGAGYYKGGADAESEHTETQLLIAKAAEAAQIATATEIAKIQIRHTTIQRKVEREILEKPVYRGSCVHTADGLRLTNQALTNRADGDTNR
jgi:hypothetical protein